MTTKISGSGFEEWKQRRQERGLDLTSDDQAYRAYVDQALGLSAQESAGVVTSGDPGAVDLSEGASVSDDQLYGAYRSELDGSASRRRAEEDARQARRDRKAEHALHARVAGYPPREQYRGDV